jgi:hypothetical protein
MGTDDLLKEVITRLKDEDFAFFKGNSNLMEQESDTFDSVINNKHYKVRMDLLRNKDDLIEIAVSIENMSLIRGTHQPVFLRITPNGAEEFAVLED